MMQENQKIAPLPGMMATLAAGFDFTAKHFWIVLLPTLLDGFFWLGPRLSFQQLVEQMVAFWQAQNLPATGLDMNVFLEIAPRTNLFTSLSVPFIGVPALMTGVMPEKTPLTTAVWELDNVALLVGLFLVFTITGLLLTALYFRLISRSLTGRTGHRLLLFQVAFDWGRLLALTAVFLIALFIVYIPLVLIGAFVAIISPALASVVLLIGPMLAAWLLIYFFFAPHGLFLNGRPLWRAMLESMQLVQRHFFSVIGLLFIVFLTNRLVETLLLTADDGSWLTLASIVGHAYISTAFLAATFIFYQDRFANMQALSHKSQVQKGQL